MNNQTENQNVGDDFVEVEQQIHEDIKSEIELDDLDDNISGMQ